MDVARGTEGAVVTHRTRGRLDEPQLRTLLFQYAEEGRDSGAPRGTSETVLYLRCAGDVPFREVRRILDLCTEPDIGIYRILFAFRAPPGVR